MFVVFDLDGTLADITHRLHYIQEGNKDWDGFFRACIYDEPVKHAIRTLEALVSRGHYVEIWSGRSKSVEDETRTWLAANGINPNRLVHMRPIGDHTRDVELKRSWLHKAAARPSLIFDDRQSVVDMWRQEGIPCFQVTANWEDKVKILPPTQQPLLTIMVGPSGGGKSTWVDHNVPVTQVLSSDHMRYEMCGDIKDQSRNADVFYAINKIARARLECGLPVTIDATHLHRKDRLKSVSLAPEGAKVRYVVINRPMHDKIRDGGWRNGVTHEKSGLSLMELHEQRFNQQISNIMVGDDLPNVSVADLRVLK